MKTKIYISIVIVLFLFNISPKVAAQCSTSRLQDSLILVKLYNATNGGNWTKKWDLSQPMNTWFGVVGGGGKINNLTLSFNNLTGTLPEELGKLCDLYSLDLGNNKLTGTVPNLSGLTNLNYFSVAGNQLSGPLPYPNAPYLQYYILFNNKFTGPFPDSLSKYPLLVNLDIRFNTFNGPIPSTFFTSHPNMQYFQLADNQFTGSIPKEIGLCKQMVEIDIRNNQLTGNIPTEINNIGRTLKAIILNNNKITGSIPASLDSDTSLTTVSLENNLLTGNIPTTFGNLRNLGYLGLSNNQLTGAVPTNLGNLSKLYYLNFSYNNLTGTIPTNLGSDTSLILLDISDNKLTGGIPSTLGNLKKLQYLSFANSGLNVALPPSLSGATKLRELYLFGNQIPGVIPPQYGLLDSLEIFQIANNQLTGTVPFELSKIKRLAHLNVANNKLDSLANFSAGLNGTVLVTPDYTKGFYFNNNKFTFDDVLPNMPLQNRAAFTYKYLPQDSIICPSQNIPLGRGDNYTIALNIDGALTTNVYKWYKDGKLIDRTNVNRLTLNNVQTCQMGNYSCVITNPSVPTMTLYCNNQQISISSPFINCEPFDMTASPNPAKTEVTIRITSPPEDVRLLKVFNIFGQEMQTMIFDESATTDGIRLDVSSYPNGNYFVSLFSASNNNVGSTKEWSSVVLTKRIQVLR